MLVPSNLGEKPHVCAEAPRTPPVRTSKPIGKSRRMNPERAAETRWEVKTERREKGLTRTP